MRVHHFIMRSLNYESQAFFFYIKRTPTFKNSPNDQVENHFPEFFGEKLELLSERSVTIFCLLAINTWRLIWNTLTSVHVQEAGLTSFENKPLFQPKPHQKICFNNNKDVIKIFVKIGFKTQTLIQCSLLPRTL